MKNRVLIFGIGGFVGEYLAIEFANHGYEVFGSDIQKKETLPSFVHFQTTDLLDGENVKHIIEDVTPTHIVNLAAISNVGLSWKIPQKTIAVNVEGTLNILEAAKDCKPMPRILLIGSSEEYAISSEPINEDYEIVANNPYGISKTVQEQFSALYRERYGMKVFHVRAFNHTGVGQTDTFVIPSWCKQAAEITKSGQSGMMYVGNLEARRDFSDVRDVVRAYRMVIESEDSSILYNVGSGRSIALKDILEYIISLSSQTIEVKVNPEFLRPLDNPVICCDNTRIRENLNWYPQYQIEKTVEEIYNNYL